MANVQETSFFGMKIRSISASLFAAEGISCDLGPLSFPDPINHLVCPLPLLTGTETGLVVGRQ